MKNLNQIDCKELSLLESQQINGGSGGFWEEVALVGAAIASGLKEFATQGGRNAGICVK